MCLLNCERGQEKYQKLHKYIKNIQKPKKSLGITVLCYKITGYRPEYSERAGGSQENQQNPFLQQNPRIWVGLEETLKLISFQPAAMKTTVCHYLFKSVYPFSSNINFPVKKNCWTNSLTNTSSCHLLTTCHQLLSKGHKTFMMTTGTGIPPGQIVVILPQAGFSPSDAR